jgi:hypothetical protein
MMTTCKYLCALAALFSLAGCGSKVSEKDSDANKEDTAFVINYTDVMEFIRGTQADFSISGNFTGEKSSPITIDGLPEGATYVDNTLTWLPPCNLKPENGQFIRGYMVRRIRITMKSTLTDGIVQRPAILIVHKDGEETVCDN